VRQDASGRTTGTYLKSDGKPVEDGGVGTMSKSKLNGVDPQDMVDRYGADAARLYVMFAAPPEATFVWSDAGVEGAQRFLRRLWTLADASADAIRPVGATADFTDASPAVKAARREVHQTLKQATYDYDRIQYNTVVSAGMKMLNALEAVPADAAGRTALLAEGLSIVIRVLYPVVPHIGCALWDELGYPAKLGPLLDAAWPKLDPAALAQDEIELVLQVNGKLRGKLTVAAGADKAAIESAARASAEVARHSVGMAIKRVIVVPGKLVNVVVG
jgi:leucyl-tRNA synthetase